jgi:hypothetical protein
MGDLVFVLIAAFIVAAIFAIIVTIVTAISGGEYIHVAYAAIAGAGLTLLAGGIGIGSGLVENPYK